MQLERALLTTVCEAALGLCGTHSLEYKGAVRVKGFPFFAYLTLHSKLGKLLKDSTKALA